MLENQILGVHSYFTEPSYISDNHQHKIEHMIYFMNTNNENPIIVEKTQSIIRCIPHGL